MAATEKKSKIVYSSMDAAEKIESNDDLLTSILVVLPPKSVFRFRCASNRWNSIVAGPFFIRSYEETRKTELERRISNSKLGTRNLMHFIQTKTYITYSQQWLYCNDDCRITLTQSAKNKIYGVSRSDQDLNVPIEYGYLLHSANGLILCGRHPNTYHILNPIVRTCVSLPPPPPRLITFDDDESDERFSSIGLVPCNRKGDYNLVPNFKVVKACIPKYGLHSKFLYIQTYSSRTREWTHSILVGTEEFCINAFNPEVFVFNCVLHWLTSDMSLVVYDSSNECDNHMQLIILPLPDAADNDDDVEEFGFNVTRSSSSDDEDNVLWCCVNNHRKKWLQLWMLPKNGRGGGYRRSTTFTKKEWILMHTITHELLPKDIDITRKYVFIELLWLFPKKAAVFNVEGFMICIYNFETKSMESCFRMGREFCSMSLYTEPLSLSSYALSPKAYDDDHDFLDKQVVAN